LRFNDSQPRAFFKPVAGLRTVGITLRASRVRLDAIPNGVIILPMPLDWSQGDLFAGLRCFHSGAFFEAHEHWEAVWLLAQEPEKAFLQALIQVAASFHHFQRGNCAGTISLLRSALCRLDSYPEAFVGVAVEPLRVAIRAWLEALETVPQSAPPPVPAITLKV
jgi:uncharacterized protein